MVRRSAIITCLLAFLLAGWEASRLYFETHNAWTSWGMIPLGFVFLLFPMSVLVNSCWIIFYVAPVLRGDERQSTGRYTNTPLPTGSVSRWPSVSIQIPIYTEPFATVIRPALDAARVAARRYRDATGQAANLVVCDDGLLVLTDNDLEGFTARALRKPADGRSDREREVLARVDYYRNHGVTWVARPKPMAGAFAAETSRRGRFKKASNLNHSFRLEAALAAARAAGPFRSGEALTPASPLWRFRFARWGGEVEIGEVILQLDKDSITHPDIILATIPEFSVDRALAYTQHAAYPTNEDDNYFAAIIAYFTRMLYDVFIPSKAMMSGSQVPVMGHNLFLRKAVIIEVGGWGEESVCEDLNFMLDCHINGHHGKYVAYPGLEFGEAVTREFGEEIEKFRRYAYGAAEAMCNQLKDWERQGVLKQSFKRYLHAPEVGWFHGVELVSFFCSLINLTSIIPMSVLLALNLDAPVQALIRNLMSSSIFTLLGTLATWRIRRGRALTRLTHGEFWRGWRGALRLLGAHLAFGFIFLGLGLATLRGALAYLFNAKVSFAATSMDDLEHASLFQLLRRMKALLLETGLVVLLCVPLLWFASRKEGGLSAWDGLWMFPFALEITLPYLLNPPLVRRLGKTVLSLFGLDTPARQAGSLRSSKPERAPGPLQATP